MLKSGLDVSHHPVIIADMHIVVEADQRIGLLVYRPNGLLGTDHQGKHLGILVGVVRLKIAPANLPRAEQLGRVVGQGPEAVGRSFGQFLFGHGPHLLESGLQVGLGVVGRTQGDELAIRLQQVVPTGARAITLVEPLVVVASHHLLLVEMAVDDPQVVLYTLVPLRPRRVVEESGNIARQAVAEEAFRADGIDDVKVVVEVNEVLRQAGNPVQVAFDHHRIVRGQELCRDIILMVHQIDFWMTGVQPRRLLATGDEMYLAHPRGKLLHATEPIAQETIIAESGFANTVFRVAPVAGILLELRLPCGVVHIHPCDNKIYVHHARTSYAVFRLKNFIPPSSLRA